MNKKNPIIAFLLAFFPGGGLFYLGKIRGIFYTLTVFGLPIMALAIHSIIGNFELPFLIIALAFGLYFINFIDTAVTASRLYHSKGDVEEGSMTQNPESERFFTIVLSFVPGLGHFQLGLVNRGLTLLVTFIGLAVMVVFVTALSSRSEFLLFLAFLPIIWVYGFFDVMQQLTKKQAGEELMDRSIMEEFEMRQDDGKKSKTLAILLSIFPGAGHLYLGLQRRGIQLMAGFLFSIYILDVLRLSIFLFLIPIIWFYSFFDGLQKASRYGKEAIEDIPVISYFINHQKWVGIGLVLLGLYYIFADMVIPAITPVVERMLNFNVQHWFYSYFQTTVVCLLLIGGGIKLIAGNKRKREGKE
ncbi:hypothetical protein CWR48_05915 [Oceanobacillus arenosus]|uniref:Multi-TM2 domain-containing protein n=1 Tax=Oceanobacillus arenosus TaxID=1229153 RepID=A0A3D8PXH8_9BACI|nr:hypothetical protein [Oceanobacillus arenosus]RDW20237.1 hypothetical protein CWR48_05915 [Oceanobacillus arenosus]